MRRHRIGLVPVLSFLIAACGQTAAPAQQDPAADLAAIANVRSAYGAAMEAGDATAIGNTGFERGHYKVTVTPKAGGAPMMQEGRYMLVLQKGPGGAWKVARDMDNQATP